VIYPATIYPATIYLAIKNPIAQIRIANLTGYRLSTAYSLGSGLCQDILRLQARMGKMKPRRRRIWKSGLLVIVTI